jgi:hypothetical protein
MIHVTNTASFANSSTLTGVKVHEYSPLPSLTMPGMISTGPEILTAKVAPSAGSMKLSMH